LEEESIPVRPEVRTACDMLGFDPLYLANEGKLIVVLPEENAGQALEILRQNPYGAMATRIGSVSAVDPEQVLLHTPYGTTRVLDMLSGEILPRIC